MTATLAALPDMADAPASPAPVASEHAEMWALVQRAQAGDREAFGRVFEHYHGFVMSFLWYRTSDRPLCEDLTSETFLRALRRVDSFSYEGRDFGAFLVTIARNLLVDYRKSLRVRREVLADEFHSWERADDDRHVQPETAVGEYLVSRDLLRAVQRLSPEQQQAIVLRYFEGLSTKETAEAMGKHEGAVKALVYRATRALSFLVPEGFAPPGCLPRPEARAGYTGARISQRRVQ